MVGYRSTNRGRGKELTRMRDRTQHRSVQDPHFYRGPSNEQPDRPGPPLSAVPTAVNGRPHTVGPELSIFVPTFNERANVRAVVEELGDVLRDVNWEVVFVDDDSPDHTARAVRKLGNEDGRVRCIQRIGRRGLATACIEGMLGSTAPYLAVMDDDLQHDVRILPAMLNALKNSDVEITEISLSGNIGTRQPNPNVVRDS